MLGVESSASGGVLQLVRGNVDIECVNERVLVGHIALGAKCQETTKNSLRARL